MYLLRQRGKKYYYHFFSIRDQTKYNQFYEINKIHTFESVFNQNS